LKHSVVPLCVDLDGTLVRGDCLFAALFWLLKHKPLRLPGLFFVLLKRGRAAFKREVALAAEGFDASMLPVVREVSQWCAARATEGRELWLVSGSDVLWVNHIIAKFPFFAKVIASDGVQNVSGEGKRRVLVQLCGERGYDYVGNAAVDLTVWRSAREGVVANAKDWLAERARNVCRVREVVGVRPKRLLSFWRSLRPGQWVKNLLLIAPLITSHRWGELDLIVAAAWGVVVFCVVASGVYLVNDAWDRDIDLQDALKRQRPVAAGELGQWTAFFSGMGLMGLSIVGGIICGVGFAIMVGFYTVMALLYSFFFKNLVGLDLAVLMGFYLLRIYAGGVATGIEISPWLASFAAAIFLFLGSLKRAMKGGALWEVVPRFILKALAFGSGAAAVGTLALYPLSSQAEELYSSNSMLWVFPLVIGVWCVWIWHRCMDAADKMEAAEPVAVVLRDPWSWAALMCCLGVMLWAI